MKSSELSGRLAPRAVEQPVVKDLGMKRERAAFDAWMESDYCHVESMSPRASDAWAAWQARAGLSDLDVLRRLILELELYEAVLYRGVPVMVRQQPRDGRYLLRADVMAAIRSAEGASVAEANPAPDVASASRSDDPTDRRVRASSAGGEEK